MSSSPLAGAGAAAGDAPARDGEDTRAEEEVFDHLTVDKIVEATGEEDLTKVKELEIIFTNVHYVGTLERLPNLRTLTLIDTGLRRISNVFPVGHSLLRLVLTQQKITRMENLELPNLRDLLLYDNQIVRIEGLSGCPRLQRLWLYSNKIGKIENLDAVGDLRELWLQNNKITRISGVEHLVNLQVLALGHNRISEFKDIQKLAHLPVLRSLSFHDVHFGSCPIAAIDGYRDFVLVSLKGLRELDGRPINDGDREAAYDMFMQQALEFGKRVDALCRDNERELLALENRRKRNLAAAAGVRDDLLGSFGELEAVVHAGREEVVKEQSRQQHVRATNLKQLERVLEQLKAEQAEWTARRVAEETHALEVERATIQALQLRAEAEARDVSALSKLSFKCKGALVAQELSEHSPDYRFLLGHFKDAHMPRDAPAVPGKKARRVNLVRLVKGFKIFSRALERRFVAAGHSPDTHRLFICGDPRQLHAALLSGLPLLPVPGKTERSMSSAGDAADDGVISMQGADGPPPLALFSDPWDAIASAMSLDPSMPAAPEPGRVHALLVCRVCTGNTLAVPAPASRSKSKHAPNINQVMNFKAAEALKTLDPEFSSACIIKDPKVVKKLLKEATGGEGTGAGAGAGAVAGVDPPRLVQGAGPVPGGMYVLRETDKDRVLPEFYILAAERGLGSSDSAETALEESLSSLASGQITVKATHESTGWLVGGGMDPDSAAVLVSYQKKAAEAVATYEENVWRELDPAVATQLAQTEGEVKKLASMLSVLRDEIDGEKQLQEQILREFRASVPSSKSGAGTPASRGGRPTSSGGYGR